MTYFDHRDDNYANSGDLDKYGDTPSNGDIAAYPQSDTLLEETGAVRRSSGGNGRGSGDGGDPANHARAMDVAPCDSDAADRHAGEALAGSPPGGQAPSMPPPPTREDTMVGGTSRGRGCDGGGVRGTAPATITTMAAKTSVRPGTGGVRATNTDKKRREGVQGGPWGVGGVLLTSLSASADALSADGSKAVRAKALKCSLRILEAHGGTVPGAVGKSRDDGAMNSRGEEGPIFPNMTKKALSTVRGAWLFLTYVRSVIRSFLWCFGLLLHALFLCSQRN